MEMVQKRRVHALLLPTFNLEHNTINEEIDSCNIKKRSKKYETNYKFINFFFSFIIVAKEELCVTNVNNDKCEQKLLHRHL